MGLTRRDVVCQWVGGAGAVASCAGMIASLAAGLLGAAGSALGQANGMAGMGSMGSSPSQSSAGQSALAFLSHIAVPLLLGSIVLMLIGVARAGRRAVAFVAAGSALLLGMMLPTPPGMTAWLLGAGYLLVFLGYAAAWRDRRIRQGAPAR